MVRVIGYSQISLHVELKLDRRQGAGSWNLIRRRKSYILAVLIGPSSVLTSLTLSSAVSSDALTPIPANQVKAPASVQTGVRVAVVYL